MIARTPIHTLVSIGLVFTGLVTAQIEFHGEVYPMLRLTKEQNYLNLPHRFVTVEGSQYGDNVSFFFSTAMEYRPGTDEMTLDLREVYAEIVNDLGDFRFGKQIVSWGAADGNNPTDNVNPYDLYYLFIPGTERKRGVLMGSANLYLGSAKLEITVTPIFQPNRIPLNEPDFPIFADAPFDPDSIPKVWPDRKLQNTEAGVRLSLPLSAMDLSVSYFTGYDRMFSPQFPTGAFPGSVPPTALIYNRTSVIGGDIVSFIGDWAIRAEAAYFLTEDKDGDSPLIRNPYIQYVLQGDYNSDESSYLIQYLGTHVTGIDGDDILLPFGMGIIREEDNELDNLSAAMGMPFANIAQNAVMASASRKFADSRYELRLNTLYDFDNGGMMVGGGVVITLEDAFDLEIGLVSLGGDKDSRMYSLRDFSHLSIGMKYSF